MNPDKIPVHIMSCYVSFFSVLVRAETSDVMLFGSYQDLLTMEFKPIMAETEFETFNRLLTIAAEDPSERTDRIITMISDHLSKRPEEEQMIAFSETGELEFPNHIFSFTLMLGEEEDMDSLEPGYVFYQLNGFLLSKGILEFYDLASDDDNEDDRISFYHKVLAVRYRFYLMHIKNMRHSKAARLANLMDPVVFRLAELQYKMMDPIP